MIKYLLIVFCTFDVMASEIMPQNHIFNAVANLSYSLVHTNNKVISSLTHQRISNWNKKEWEQSFINLRYKLNANWQLGLSHGHQRGNNSNFDWMMMNGVGFWKNVEHRIENLSDLTLNYKTLFDSFVFEWRNSIRQNWHFNSQRFITKMSFNFFNMSCGLKCNTILSIEEHLPLNESENENETRESWIYLTTLFHLNDNILIGPKLTHFKRTWKATQEFQDNTNKDFERFDILNMYGIQIINRF